MIVKRLAGYIAQYASSPACSPLYLCRSKRRGPLQAQGEAAC